MKRKITSGEVPQDRLITLADFDGTGTIYAKRVKSGFAKLPVGKQYLIIHPEHFQVWHGMRFAFFGSPKSARGTIVLESYYEKPEHEGLAIQNKTIVEEFERIAADDPGFALDT